MTQGLTRGVPVVREEARRRVLRQMTAGVTFLSVFPSLILPAWAAPGIGRVSGVRVYAYGTPEGSKRGPIYARSEVFQNEVVETVKNGALHITFLDDTVFRLGAESEATLDRFVYDPDSNAGAMVAHLGKGAFRFITGKLDKTGFQVVTPTAIIGVRGTDFVVAVSATGSTTVSVNEGEVEISAVGGGPSTAVGVGQRGTVTEAGVGVDVSEGGSASNDIGLTDSGADAGAGGSDGGGGDGGGGGGGGCFTAETRILLADGSHKLISDIALGDKVLSFDFGRHCQIASEVTRRHQFYVDEYLRLNGLNVTPSHPFAVGNDRWRVAGKLGVGDRVFGQEPTTISDIERIPNSTEVFNMTVDGTHNYYVAAESGSFLVHNKD